MRERSAPLPVPDGLLRDRVNLTSMISSMLDGSYASPISDHDFQKVVQPTSESAEAREQIYNQLMEFWDDTAKPERMALTAILIDAVWNDPIFVERRQNFTPQFPPSQLREELGSMFKEQVRLTLASICDPSHPKHRILLRLTQFTNWSQRYFFELANNSPAEEIWRGINTAQHVAWGLIDVFLKLAKTKHIILTKTQARVTLDRAMSKIGMVLASLNKSIGVLVIDEISQEGSSRDSYHYLEPDFFDLEQEVGQNQPTWRLVMDRNKITRLMEFGIEEQKRSPKSQTTWCPARYAVGDHPAPIGEYFKWVLDTAFQYSPELANLPE